LTGVRADDCDPAFYPGGHGPMWDLEEDLNSIALASPRYLAERPRITEPADLIEHHIVTTTHFGHNAWVFPPLSLTLRPRVGEWNLPGSLRWLTC
jgi:hypothetical protein